MTTKTLSSRRPFLRSAVVLPLVALAASSCRSTEPAAEPVPESTDETRQESDTPSSNVKFETIQSGPHSGIANALYTCIDDAARWQAFWDVHANRALPRAPLPEVDFTRECVLVLALGQRPSGGWGVEVDAVRAEGGLCVVEARERRPEAGRPQTAIVTTPFVIVRVPRFEGRVEYRVE